MDGWRTTSRHNFRYSITDEVVKCNGYIILKDDTLEIYMTIVVYAIQFEVCTQYQALYNITIANTNFDFNGSPNGRHITLFLPITYLSLNH